MNTFLTADLHELESRLQADAIPPPTALRERVLSAARAAILERRRRQRTSRWLQFAAAAVAVLIALNAACAARHTRPPQPNWRARAVRLAQFRNSFEEP